jgi:chloramphenicol 3-O-phosphotransferase
LLHNVFPSAPLRHKGVCSAAQLEHLAEQFLLRLEGVAFDGGEESAGMTLFLLFPCAGVCTGESSGEEGCESKVSSCGVFGDSVLFPKELLNDCSTLLDVEGDDMKTTFPE